MEYSCTRQVSDLELDVLSLPLLREFPSHGHGRFCSLPGPVRAKLNNNNNNNTVNLGSFCHLRLRQSQMFLQSPNTSKVHVTTENKQIRVTLSGNVYILAVGASTLNTEQGKCSSNSTPWILYLMKECFHYSGPHTSSFQIQVQKPQDFSCRLGRSSADPSHCICTSSTLWP